MGNRPQGVTGDRGRQAGTMVAWTRFVTGEEARVIGLWVYFGGR